MLARADDHILADLGLSRGDVSRRLLGPALGRSDVRCCARAPSSGACPVMA